LLTAGALDEVDWLKAKLEQLEVSILSHSLLATKPGAGSQGRTGGPAARQATHVPEQAQVAQAAPPSFVSGSLAGHQLEGRISAESADALRDCQQKAEVSLQLHSGASVVDRLQVSRSTDSND
jgi:hypothetical protein